MSNDVKIISAGSDGHSSWAVYAIKEDAPERNPSMNDKFTITLPPLPDDADHWAVYVSQPEWNTPADTRTLYQRTMRRLLLWLHNHTETLWHWLWRKACKYAPPKSEIIGSRHYKLGEYGNE